MIIPIKGRGLMNQGSGVVSSLTCVWCSRLTTREQTRSFAQKTCGQCLGFRSLMRWHGFGDMNPVEPLDVPTILHYPESLYSKSVQQI